MAYTPINSDTAQCSFSICGYREFRLQRIKSDLTNGLTSQTHLTPTDALMKKQSTLSKLKYACLSYYRRIRLFSTFMFCLKSAEFTCLIELLTTERSWCSKRVGISHIGQPV